MNFISMLAGFIAAIAIASYGLLTIMSNASQDHGFAAHTALVFGTAFSAMVGAAVVRLAVLALLARVVRGAAAVEWCRPSECTSFSAWLGSAWKFKGNGGLQEGLRVCGMGIALRGTHGSEPSRTTV